MDTLVMYSTVVYNHVATKLCNTLVSLKVQIESK